MHDFKSYATRALNEREATHKRWTRHGSTRYLWTRGDLDGAVDYVILSQGQPMAVFPAV